MCVQMLCRSSVSFQLATKTASMYQCLHFDMGLNMWLDLVVPEGCNLKYAYHDIGEEAESSSSGTKTSKGDEAASVDDYETTEDKNSGDEEVGEHSKGEEEDGGTRITLTA